MIARPPAPESSPRWVGRKLGVSRTKMVAASEGATLTPSKPRTPWKPTAAAPCFPGKTPQAALNMRMDGLLPPVLSEAPKRRELPPYTAREPRVTPTKPREEPRVGFGRTNHRPGSAGSSPALLPGERHGGVPAGFRGKIRGIEQPQAMGAARGYRPGSRGSSRGSSEFNAGFANASPQRTLPRGSLLDPAAADLDAEFDGVYNDAVHGSRQPSSARQPAPLAPEKLIACAAELVAMGYDENLCRAAALKAAGDTMQALEMVVMGAVTEVDVPQHLRHTGPIPAMAELDAVEDEQPGDSTPRSQATGTSSQATTLWNTKEGFLTGPLALDTPLTDAVDTADSTEEDPRDNNPMVMSPPTGSHILPGGGQRPDTGSSEWSGDMEGLDGIYTPKAGEESSPSDYSPTATEEEPDDHSGSNYDSGGGSDEGFVFANFGGGPTPEDLTASDDEDTAGSDAAGDSAGYGFFKPSLEPEPEPEPKPETDPEPEPEPEPEPAQTIVAPLPPVLRSTVGPGVQPACLPEPEPEPEQPVDENELPYEYSTPVDIEATTPLPTAGGGELGEEEGSPSPPTPDIDRERSLSEMGMMTSFDSGSPGGGDYGPVEAPHDESTSPAVSSRPASDALSLGQEQFYTFEEEGSLGILFQADDEYGAVTIGGIGDGSAAERLGGGGQGGLEVGMVLVSVQGRVVVGMPFEEVLDILMEQGRPLTLGFLGKEPQDEESGAATEQAPAEAVDPAVATQDSDESIAETVVDVELGRKIKLGDPVIRAELARTIARCTAAAPTDGGGAVVALSKDEQATCVRHMRDSSLFSFCPQAQLEAIVRQLSAESHKRLLYIIALHEEEEQEMRGSSDGGAAAGAADSLAVSLDGTAPVEVVEGSQESQVEAVAAAQSDVPAATARTVSLEKAAAVTQQQQEEDVVETASAAAALSETAPKATIGTLREAVRAGDAALVRHMLTTGAESLGNIAQPSDKGPTPLHWAASHGHVEIAKMLLEGDSNNWAVVTQQEDGRTPLHLAAIHRHANVLRVLVEGRPSQVKPSMLVGMRDEQKRTALYSACSVGSGSGSVSAVAAVLLEYGPAFVDSGDGSGICPLHLAARQGDAALVEVLLRCEPDLEAIDDAGRTPLVCATMEGHTAVVQVLLEAGASARIADASGSDARSWAELLEHDEISALFDGGGSAPLAVDTNGDGRADAVDTVGDGRVDAFDTNHDGHFDAFDTNHDGNADLFTVAPGGGGGGGGGAAGASRAVAVGLRDTNGDGNVDSIVSAIQ